MITIEARAEQTLQARVLGYTYTRNGIILTWQTGTVNSSGDFEFNFDGTHYQKHYFITGEAFDRVKEHDQNTITIPALLRVIEQYNIEGTIIKVDAQRITPPPVEI